MFRRLDSILLRQAQSFCDKVKQVTGITKFRLEKWALVMATTFIWGIIAYKPISFGVVMGLIHTAGAAFVIRETEKREKEFLANEMLRLSAFHIVSVRLILSGSIFAGSVYTLILMPNVVGALVTSSEMCIIAWVYFSACVPRPPSKSRVREWYEKMLSRFQGELQPMSVITEK